MSSPPRYAYADRLASFMWMALQKTLHVGMKVLTHFWYLRSHNFPKISSNWIKIGIVVAKLAYNIVCKVFKDWYNFKEVTVVWVTLCKLHEHGGFSQRQSHIC